jgi:hypothetical protein
MWIESWFLSYPLVNIQKAIENGILKWVFPWKMVIFHSYVSLPEGNIWDRFLFFFRLP